MTLIVSPLEKLQEQGEITREIMVEASRQVLGGFALRVGVEPFVDRYMDERGASMWNLVMRLLKECDPPQLQYQGENLGPRVPTAAAVSTYANSEVDHSCGHFEIKLRVSQLWHPIRQ